MLGVEQAIQVDADWMTHILRARGRLAAAARVVELDRTTCGTGQLGDSFRFTLRYEPAGAGPATLVGKFTSQDPTSREFGRSSGYYRSEIRFYEELAEHLPVALPTAIYARLAQKRYEEALADFDSARLERELGSPVEPLSIEAYILSAADDLDATLHQVKQTLEESGHTLADTDAHRREPVPAVATPKPDTAVRARTNPIAVRRSVPCAPCKRGCRAGSAPSAARTRRWR